MGIPRSGSQPKVCWSSCLNMFAGCLLSYVCLFTDLIRRVQEKITCTCKSCVNMWLVWAIDELCCFTGGSQGRSRMLKTIQQLTRKSAVRAALGYILPQTQKSNGIANDCNDKSSFPTTRGKVKWFKNWYLLNMWIVLYKMTLQVPHFILFLQGINLNLLFLRWV